MYIWVKNKQWEPRVICKSFALQEVVWDWQKSCVHIAATFHSLTEYKDIRYTANNWSGLYIHIFLFLVVIVIAVLQANTMINKAKNPKMLVAGTNNSSIWCSKYFFFIISCKNCFNLFSQFFYNFTTIKIKTFECPKSIRNYEKKKYLECQGLGRQFVCPIGQVN